MSVAVNDRPARRPRKEIIVKTIAVITLAVATLIPAAHAVAADSITFTGNIKADKIKPGNKLYVNCALHNIIGGEMAAKLQPIGVAAADGTYNGPFVVVVNFLPADKASISNGNHWRCDARQDGPGGNPVNIGGSAPVLQGKL